MASWQDAPVASAPPAPTTSTAAPSGWAAAPQVGAVPAAAPAPPVPKFPQDEPGYTYGNILPFRVKQDAQGNPIPGSQELAAPEILRSPVRGMQDIGKRLTGPMTPQKLKTLNPDELGLVMGAGGVRVPPAVKAPTQAGMLDAAGVRLTPGQAAADIPVSGSIIKRAEDAMTSVPLVGDMILRAKKTSVADFNRAVVDKALEPIGEALPKGMEPGREAIGHAQEAIGKFYDKTLADTQFKADPQFVTDLTNLKSLVNEMPPDQVKQFHSILRNRLDQRLQPTGTMDGKTFKQVDSELRNMIDGYRRSPDMASKQLGTAFMEIRSIMLDALERENPGIAADLQKANQSYAMLSRVEDASMARATPDGIFSPADLVRQIKSAAKATGRRKAFARGDALMQDFAEAGQGVLPSSLPDSGTGRRVMVGELAGLLGAGAGASYMGHPQVGAAALAGVLGGSALYTNPGIAAAKGIGSAVAAAAAQKRAAAVAALVAAQDARRRSTGLPPSGLNAIAPPSAP